MKIQDKFLLLSWAFCLISLLFSLVFLVGSIFGCSSINKAFGLHDDNPIEQFFEEEAEEQLEDVIPVHWDIDFTPDSK